MSDAGLVWTVFVRGAQGVDVTIAATRDGAPVWVCCIAGSVAAPGAVARVVTSDPLAALAALGVERPSGGVHGAPASAAPASAAPAAPAPAPGKPKRGGR